MAQSTGLQRRSRTMNTDNHGEENSPFRRRRLPSLNALRCFEAAARPDNFSRPAPVPRLSHGSPDVPVGHAHAPLRPC
ncbi:hypothetical protein [Klebsiella pneumoniae]|uniref:hypothetical protein n=1 Tax=Klebsiella pneumoniae TaxID=573 RepID=UPI001C58D7F0|nr:hypothetical protein [Klebsiella pneumoniae]